MSITALRSGRGKFQQKLAGTSVFLMLLTGAASCGYSLERETARMLRQQQRAAEALRNRSDADSLAAAALFTYRRSPADALALIKRATSIDTRKPELTWLQLQICRKTDGCDSGPIEARLRQLDPENGLGWFGALDRAYEGADDVALEQALADVGRSKRVDSYFSTLGAHLSEATADANALSLPEAIISVFGEISVVALPGYTAAAKGCGAERLQRPSIREACRSLSESLMAGDTHLGEMIGVAIAKRAWPADSPQWQAASEARRVYKYRTRALRDTDWADDWDEAVSVEYLDLVAQHYREQDVLIAQLIARGIDPKPPAAWTIEESP